MYTGTPEQTDALQRIAEFGELQTALEEIARLRSRLAALEAQIDARRNIDRYVSFALAGDESVNPQDAADRVLARLAEAEREADALLAAVAAQFGVADNWEPLPDVAGKITQISNIVAGLRSRLAEAEARHDVWPPFGESFTVPVDKMDAQFIAWLRDNCVIVTRESWERLNRGTAPDACPHDRCAQRLDGETITVTCTKCGRQATGVIGQSWTAPDSTGSAPGTGR